MIRRPPRSTRTYTLFPSTTLFRSDGVLGGWATINGSDYAKVLGGGIIAFDATDYTDKDDASSWLDGEIISDSENAPDTPFRSEERRVGKECARTVRSRWSPEH